MSNRANSRKHGRHRAERIRKSKILRLKINKATCRSRQIERQDAIAVAKADFEAKISA